LREFFTSATLVAVVDLPFVFFFIWVISLIAGPLALVPLVAVPIVIFVGLIIQPFLARIAERSMQTSTRPTRGGANSYFCGTYHSAIFGAHRRAFHAV